MRTKRLVVGIVSAGALVLGVMATGTAWADESDTRTVTTKIRNSSTGLLITTVCADVTTQDITRMPGGDQKCINDIPVAQTGTITFNIPADEPGGFIRFHAKVGGFNTNFEPRSVLFDSADPTGCTTLIGRLTTSGNVPRFVPC